MALAEVLVVDDDVDLAEAVRDLLVSDGRFDVRIAHDGAEALATIEGKLPDIILLDMRMPVMNGWEFTRIFSERYDHLAPLIAFTAAESVEQRAREVGAEGYVPKPFDLRQLFTELERHVGGAAKST